MYFPVFKLKSWVKRSVSCRRRFIQRFHSKRTVFFNDSRQSVDKFTDLIRVEQIRSWNNSFKKVCHISQMLIAVLKCPSMLLYRITIGTYYCNCLK